MHALNLEDASKGGISLSGLLCMPVFRSFLHVLY